MENSLDSLGRGAFMKKTWDEIRKGGGRSFDIATIKGILEEDDDMRTLERGELIDKVLGYFKSCAAVVEDKDTGQQVTEWVRNPTKTGLAIVVGVKLQTLQMYVEGLNQAKQPFKTTGKIARVHPDDFDVIRKAYQLIETFYEEKLGDNRNNAGVIYWLNNAKNSKWSNEQEFKFSNGTPRDMFDEVMTVDEITKKLEQDIPYDEDSDED